MRPHIIIFLILLSPYLYLLESTLSSHGDSVFLQQATTVVGTITRPLKPNTQIGDGEQNIAPRGSRDIATPVIGLVLGVSLTAGGIIYRYAYKRLHAEKSKRGAT
ncbi:MAG: hypothetical protein RQ885_12015 [Desulfurococcales archaeon]|jgi:hypothetical protein|nr:hypothetical protein [Desulfurococcales archaeon]